MRWRPWKVLEEVNIHDNLLSGVIPGVVKHGRQLERHPNFGVTRK